MAEITRHFTATTFVVRDGKVLLHLHAKQQLWLPPGGHIDRDELPHDAAVREIEEETGLRLHLHSEPQAAELASRMECGVVPQPAFILVEDINPFHQHIDLTYFATIPHDAPLCQAEDSALRRNGFAWFAPEDLDDLDADTVPTNVREGARLAIAYFEAGQSN